MAIAANIVLLDAQATPVSHTFVPLGRDSKNQNMYWFEDQSGSSSLGWNRISFELVRDRGNLTPGASSQQRTNRVKIGLHTPIMETLSTADSGFTPAATIAYVPRCNVEFIISDRATTQNRKDLRKYAWNLMNEAQVVNMVENFISVN